MEMGIYAGYPWMKPTISAVCLDFCEHISHAYKFLDKLPRLYSAPQVHIVKALHAVEHLYCFAAASSRFAAAGWIAGVPLQFPDKARLPHLRKAHGPTAAAVPGGVVHRSAADEM